MNECWNYIARFTQYLHVPLRRVRWLPTKLKIIYLTERDLWWRQFSLGTIITLSQFEGSFPFEKMNIPFATFRHNKMTIKCKCGLAAERQHVELDSHIFASRLKSNPRTVGRSLQFRTLVCIPTAAKLFSKFWNSWTGTISRTGTFTFDDTLTLCSRTFVSLFNWRRPNLECPFDFRGAEL